MKLGDKVKVLKAKHSGILVGDIGEIFYCSERGGFGVQFTDVRFAGRIVRTLAFFDADAVGPVISVQPAPMELFQ